MRSIASGLLLLGCARSELELSPSIPQQDSSPPADACSGSCSSSSGSDAASNVDASRAREVTVQLIDYDLEPGADRPVSFNRANGEMYGMATTDSEGKATHVLEDGGSITSLLRVNRQSILYTMTAVDSATKSIVLRLPANTTTLPRLGTLEFELPGPVPGATRYAAHAGCIQTSPVTPLTIQLSKGCLDSAGRASAIVWAYRDALPLAYSIAADIPILTDGRVDDEPVAARASLPAWRTDFGKTTIRFEPDSYLQTALVYCQPRDEDTQYLLGTAYQTSGAVEVAWPADFCATLAVQSWRLQGAGSADDVAKQVAAPFPAELVLDVEQALIPSVISSGPDWQKDLLSLSWQPDEVARAADIYEVGLVYDVAASDVPAMWLISAPAQHESVLFPRLPPDLAQYGPARQTEFQTMLEGIVDVTPSTYADFGQLGSYIFHALAFGTGPAYWPSRTLEARASLRSITIL